MTAPAVSMKSQVTTMRAMLASSRAAVEAAVLRIYQEQTATEQSSEMTIERNGVGFSAYDAEILSSFASRIGLNARGLPMGQRLSAKQFAWAEKKIASYAGQLVRLGWEGPEDEPPTPPAAPAAAMTACDGCQGDGLFHGRGYTGQCFRCGGKGRQDEVDRKRNAFYDAQVRLRRGS